MIHKCICTGTHISEKVLKSLEWTPTAKQVHISHYRKSTKNLKIDAHYYKSVYFLPHKCICTGTHNSEKVLKSFKMVPNATQVLMYRYAHYRKSTKMLKC